MISETLTGPWRKSSASGGQEQCVELAPTSDDGRAIRDSKNPLGGMLKVGPAAWDNLRANLPGQ